MKNIFENTIFPINIIELYSIQMIAIIGLN